MDTRPLVAALTDVERKQLLETDYAWKTTEGVQRLGLDLKTRHPILEERSGRDIVRFSCNNLIREDDDFAAGLQERWHAAFDHDHVAVEYRERDMLVWDNWRLLHARNAFSDRSRHLRRIQIAG